MAAAFCALALAGCGAAAVPQGVAEVVPRIRALDGKTVSVVGYLGECGGYECRLFVDEAGWHAFQREIERVKRTRGMTHFPPHLGIGSGAIFDAKARAFAPGYVVVTGSITNGCRDAANEPACLDRLTDLEPTDIQRWSPAKTH